MSRHSRIRSACSGPKGPPCRIVNRHVVVASEFLYSVPAIVHDTENRPEDVAGDGPVVIALCRLTHPVWPMAFAFLVICFHTIGSYSIASGARTYPASPAKS